MKTFFASESIPTIALHVVHTDSGKYEDAQQQFRSRLSASDSLFYFPASSDVFRGEWIAPSTDLRVNSRAFDGLDERYHLKFFMP